MILTWHCDITQVFSKFHFDPDTDDGTHFRRPRGYYASEYNSVIPFANQGGHLQGKFDAFEVTMNLIAIKTSNFQISLSTRFQLVSLKAKIIFGSRKIKYDFFRKHLIHLFQ